MTTEAALLKAREIVKRFIVAQGPHLHESWREALIKDCGLIEDALGFVTVPVTPSVCTCTREGSSCPCSCPSCGEGVHLDPRPSEASPEDERVWLSPKDLRTLKSQGPGHGYMSATLYQHAGWIAGEQAIAFVPEQRPNDASPERKCVV